LRNPIDHEGASEVSATTTHLSDDEKRLAELGYKQELNRSWSGFSNFAISFSIISILAGCFTTFGVGWNNGGPAAIAWGWPITAAFHPRHRPVHVRAGVGVPDVGRHLLVGVQAGGANGRVLHRLAELIGLFAIDASVAYGCATFFDLTLDTYSTSWASGYSLNECS